MSWTSFKRWRWKALLGALAVTLLFLLLPTRFTSPYRILFARSLRPVRGLAFDAGGAVAAGPRSKLEGAEAADRARALEIEILRLRNRLRRVEHKLRISEDQRRSLQRIVEVTPEVTPVAGRIIGYDSDPLRRAVQLDIGSERGVRRAAAVCFAGALAGLVREVSGSEARVVLLSDPSCRVPARVQRSRVPCIVQGNGGPELDALWVERDADVRVGDLLVTNAFGGQGGLAPATSVPGGIPIGQVVQAVPSRSRPMVMAIRVRPLLNLDRIEVAEVLRGE